MVVMYSTRTSSVRLYTVDNQYPSHESRPDSLQKNKGNDDEEVSHSEVSHARSTKQSR